MNKKIIALVLSIFAILIFGMIGFVSACISFPKIETKNNCTIEFISEYQNETAILAKLNNNKVACNLNTEDISTLKDFVLNGYSVKEQTESEYDTFLEEAKQANEGRPEDCLDYLAVYRNNTWTGYIRMGSVYSAGRCAVTTCSNPVTNIIWNDLLPIAKNDCKNLYWIDNDNKECSQKEFCGLYMYLGLQTFNSKTQCEKALNSTPECAVDSDCPSVINLCGAPTGPNYQSCLERYTKEKICVDGKCKEGKICPNNSDSENNSCFKTLSNGRKAEIKIMPETASETAIAKLGELGFTIELKEVGKGDDAKPVYELTGNKQGKFLGIFKIIARVQAQVDAEDGKVKVIKPWWSFLASEINF